MPLIFESDFNPSNVSYGKNGMLPEIPDTYLSLIDSGTLIGVSIDPLREDPSLQIRIKTEEEKKDYIVTFFKHLQNKHYHLYKEIRYFPLSGVEHINAFLYKLGQEFTLPQSNVIPEHYRWYVFFHKIKDGTIQTVVGTYYASNGKNADRIIQGIQNSLIQLLELES